MGAIRVVVVHANRMGAEVLQYALSRDPDIDVVAGVTRPAAAVDAVATTDADVALIDNSIGGGDGPSVAASLRDRCPGTGLLMLVEEGSDVTLRAAVRAGCAGVVSEESSMNDALDAIRRVARGEVLLGADVLARLLPLRPVAPAPSVDLSRRELEVLRLLVDGLSTQDIAERLTVSPHTVRNHVQRVLVKLRAGSRLEAVALAVRQGLIER